MEIPKKQYQVPALTVVEFKIERGYVGSVNLANVTQMADELNRFVETRTEQETQLWNEVISSQGGIEGRTEGAGFGDGFVDDAPGSYFPIGF